MTALWILLILLVLAACFFSWLTWTYWPSRRRNEVPPEVKRDDVFGAMWPD